MSEYAIMQKGAIVFGTAYDENFTPHTTFTESIGGLEAFKGSKYVQSVVGRDTFRQIKRFLDQGRFVVYIGTPCQIAGLLTYLGGDYSNLLTVDLICHGVAPVRYFCDEIAEVRKRLGRKGRSLSNVRFRGNDGYNYRMTFWDGLGRRLESRKLRGENLYFAGFLRGIILRENCYACPYARPERISDLTLGDFIGLGKTVPFPENAHNVSSVMLNTDKARAFYADMLAHMPDVVSIERDYAERLEYRPSLREPFARHPLNRRFRDYYQKFGYVVAIQKTLAGRLRWERVHRNCVAVCRFPVRAMRKIYRYLRRV